MAVIFSVLVGGQLFGFLGMLLALPVAAVANVLLRYAVERYRASRMYQGDHPHGGQPVPADGSPSMMIETAAPPPPRDPPPA
jgi:hypothetical protein